jgi:hypothetical protein
MHRLISSALLFSLVAVGFAEDADEEDSPIRSASPDGRFALRISSPSDSTDRKAELIEKSSGKALVDFGVPYRHQVLVWSTDSKWLAYCNRGDRSADLRVYFWNGTAFESIELPEDLPSPNIKFPKKAGAVKNYGGGVEPLRWSKAGELQLKSDAMMLSRDDGATYTGTLRFTLKFGAQHHVSITDVSKTKTEVSR